MNILIIGGLLLLALVAILSAVLLALSEQRTANLRANGRATPRNSMPVAEQLQTASRPAAQTAPLRQNLPTTAESQLPYSLNGQFHELAAELRTLYQQAWDLERRLRSLTEIADRIEDIQSGQFSIEEEAHSQPTANSTVV